MLIRLKNEISSKSETLTKQSAEISDLRNQLRDRKLECDSLLKEKDFLQYRVQRLEGQVSMIDKAAIREEVQRDMHTENRLRELIVENDRFKEELIGNTS